MVQALRNKTGSQSSSDLSLSLYIFTPAALSPGRCERDSIIFARGACARNLLRSLRALRALRSPRALYSQYFYWQEPARRRPFIAATAGAGPASYTSRALVQARALQRRITGFCHGGMGPRSRGVASDALASFYVAPCIWCGARREASATASFLPFVQEATDSARTVWGCWCRVVVAHAWLLRLLAAQACGYHRPLRDSRVVQTSLGTRVTRR